MKCFSDKGKTVGLCPTPHKLFGKKFEQKLFLSFLPLTFLLLTLAACTRGLPELYAPALNVAVATRVDTAVVEWGPVANVTRHEGAVRVRSYALDFGRAAGAFGAYYVVLGQQVTYGQLLARLDREALDEQIEAQEERLADLRRDHAEANRLQDIAIDIMLIEQQHQMRAAADRFDEAGMLEAQRRSIAIDGALMELEQQRQRQAFAVADMQRNLDELHARIPTMEIRAPFAGTITHMNPLIGGSHVGAFAPVIFMTAQQPELFIEQLSGTPIVMHWIQEIRVNIAGQFHDATHVPLTIEEQAFYLQHMGSPALPRRFVLTHDPMPPVGTMATIYAYSDRQAHTLRVPRNALVPSLDGGFYAYRLEHGVPVPVRVAVTLNTNSYAAISGGLQEGDVVVVRP